MKPTYFWDINGLNREYDPKNDMKLWNAHKYDDLNRYRKGGLFFKTLPSGITVAERHFDKGNVGAGGDGTNNSNPPDFFRGQVYWEKGVWEASAMTFLYFPIGFFSKTRKGKLPVGLRSEEKTRDMQVFEFADQPDAIQMLTMFWSDRDDSGNVISLKRLSRNRDSAMWGGYLYGKLLPRVNKKKGVVKPVPAKYRLTEGEWLGLHQISYLNKPGKKDGAVEFYFASQSATGGKWEKALRVDGIGWREGEDVMLDGGNIPMFMGGGNPDTVYSSSTGSGPTENVFYQSGS